MEVSLALKIKEDKKLHDFLMKNSYYYILLNRNPKYYDELLKEYKKYNRNNNMEKINDAIDNAELISNIIKIME